MWINSNKLLSLSWVPGDCCCFVLMLTTSKYSSTPALYDVTQTCNHIKTSPHKAANLNKFEILTGYEKENVKMKCWLVLHLRTQSMKVGQDGVNVEKFKTQFVRKRPILPMCIYCLQQSNYRRNSPKSRYFS